MNKAESFKDRIKVNNSKKIITEKQLNEISKKFTEKSKKYINTNKDIDIKNVLKRCKKYVNYGESYIINIQEEDLDNLAGIIPLEEIALMEVFSDNQSNKNEVTVSLDDYNVNIRLNSNSNKKTIEINFDNIQKNISADSELQI